MGIQEKYFGKIGVEGFHFLELNVNLVIRF